MSPDPQFPPNVDDVFRLSPMQRMMLLHALASPNTTVLSNQVCYELEGELHVDAFVAALETLITRHAALRTAFLWKGLAQPVQVVRGSVPFALERIDLSGLKESERERAVQTLRAEDHSKPFRLGKPPLIRCTLLELSPKRHMLVMSVHHLIVDRWSYGVLFAELCLLYTAERAGSAVQLANAPSFKSYVSWIAEQDSQLALQFWRSELQGFTSPTLLTAGASSPTPRGRTHQSLSLGPELEGRLRKRAATGRTTPASLFLAATAIVIARRSGAMDLVVGVTAAGRPVALSDAESTIGSFVNNVPSRLRLKSEQEISAWLRDIQLSQVRRQDFEHVSTAEIYDCSDVRSPAALFDLLVLINLDAPPDPDWPDLIVRPLSATLDASYPVLLSFGRAAEGIELRLVLDKSLDTVMSSFLQEISETLSALSQAGDKATLGDVFPEINRTEAPKKHVDAGTGVGTETAARALPRLEYPPSEPLPDALRRAWAEALGLDEVGLDDDFFVLGGRSLQAARLFARVETLVGRALPLSTLFTAGTVRALLATLDHPIERGGSLVGIRTSGTKIPLVVVPGIGGDVVGLAALARALPQDRPFYGLESRGLTGQVDPIASIEGIAEDFVEQVLEVIPGDVHMLGLCWGAAVAFDMARLFHSRGRRVTSVALMDPAVLLRRTGEASARTEASSGARFLKGRLQLYWDEFVEGGWDDRRALLADKIGRATGALRSGTVPRPDASEMRRARVRSANEEAVVRYDPEPIQARARLFVTGERELATTADPRLEWTGLVDPAPSVTIIPGVNSGDAITPENVLAFAAALDAWLTETESAST